MAEEIKNLLKKGSGYKMNKFHINDYILLKNDEWEVIGLGTISGVCMYKLRKSITKEIQFREVEEIDKIEERK